MRCGGDAVRCGGDAVRCGGDAVRCGSDVVHDLQGHYTNSLKVNVDCTAAFATRPCIWFYFNSILPSLQINICGPLLPSKVDKPLMQGYRHFKPLWPPLVS